MTTDTTQAPPTIKQVFVYGTLRPGCGNDRLWKGLAWDRFDGECHTIGYKLVTHGAFPYMVPASASQSQDVDPHWLNDTVAVYRTAVHHIILDNTPEQYLPEVDVQSTISGVTYMPRFDQPDLFGGEL